jgi:hypothetical protein
VELLDKTEKDLVDTENHITNRRHRIKVMREILERVSEDDSEDMQEARKVSLQ